MWCVKLQETEPAGRVDLPRAVLHNLPDTVAPPQAEQLAGRRGGLLSEVHLRRLASERDVYGCGISRPIDRISVEFGLHRLAKRHREAQSHHRLVLSLRQG